MEKIKKIRTLLGLELYEITNKFMYKLQQNLSNPSMVFEILPEYTINDNENANNSPIKSEYYHQFVGVIEPTEIETYLYFNLQTMDATLKYEIGNVGIEDMFKDIDFKEILSNFVPHSEENIENVIFPTTYYLIVEIKYIKYQSFEDTDYDVEYDIIGYLDCNMNAIYFKEEKQK